MIEPKTIEEAEERRVALGKELQNLQMELTKVKSSLSEGRLPNIVFAKLNRKREGICKDKDEVSHELAEVKKWIKLHNKQIAREVYAESEDINMIPGKLVHFAHASRTLIQELKLRIEELLAENRALHQRLQGYELDNVNTAPDSGREGWRQDDNQGVQQ